MKNFLLFSLLAVLSCKESGEKKFLKAFGTWKIERFPYSHATLSIDKDHTFEFRETRELSNAHSTGTWKIKDDTLIMTSIMPKECLYITNFSPYCENKFTAVEPCTETTIKDCEPKDITVIYTKFNDEKFLYRNDSLIYINQNKDCANKQYPYKIFR